MAVHQDILARVDEALSRASSERAALTLLRYAARGLSTIRCDAEDIREERPFRAYPRCDLFLLDGRDHRFRITHNLEEATGFVVAPKPKSCGAER